MSTDRHDSWEDGYSTADPLDRGAPAPMRSSLSAEDRRLFDACLRTLKRKVTDQQRDWMITQIEKRLESGDPGVAVAQPPPAGVIASYLVATIQDAIDRLAKSEDGRLSLALYFTRGELQTIHAALVAVRTVDRPRCPECNHPVASHLQRGYCEESSIAGPVGTHCSCTLRDMENRIRINSGQLGVWEADGRAIVTERALRAVAPPPPFTFQWTAPYLRWEFTDTRGDQWSLTRTDDPHCPLMIQLLARAVDRPEEPT